MIAGNVAVTCDKAMSSAAQCVAARGAGGPAPDAGPRLGDLGVFTVQRRPGDAVGDGDGMPARGLASPSSASDVRRMAAMRAFTCASRSRPPAHSGGCAAVCSCNHVSRAELGKLSSLVPFSCQTEGWQ